MKKVIRLTQEKEVKKKPIEFLEYWDEGLQEWKINATVPSEFYNVLFRGMIEGLDYFVAWDNDDYNICQFRGHLNSGEY